MTTRTSMNGEGLEVNSPGDRDNSLGRKDELHGGKESTADSGMNVEDFLLPRTLISRLAKGVLPPNTSIHRDALLAITKAATVFVSYLSSHANDATDKKTIAPQDVLSALTEIEFDTFRPRLQRELAVYTEVALRKRRNKSEKKNTDNSTNGVREPSSNESRPNPKRLKREDDLHNDQAGIEESKKGILVTGASKGTNDIINGEDVGQHQSDAHEEDDGGHSDEEDEDGFENEEEDEDESEVEDDDQSLYNEDGGRVTNSHVHDDAIRLEGFSGSPGSDSGRTTHIDPCSDLDSDSD